MKKSRIRGKGMGRRSSVAMGGGGEGFGRVRRGRHGERSASYGMGLSGLLCIIQFLILALLTVLLKK